MEPDKSNVCELPDEQVDSSSSEVKISRKKVERALAALRLPGLLLNRLQQMDWTDAKGQDLKQKGMDYCREIDTLLARIHSLPELTDDTEAAKKGVRKLGGDKLYEDIKRSLETTGRAIQAIIRRSTGYWSYDYLLNTTDTPHAPRNDMEAIIELFHEMRPLDVQIRRCGPSDLIDEYGEKTVAAMNETKSHYIGRCRIQREIEERLTRALEDATSAEEIVRLTLTATSSQMELSYNVVAQGGSQLRLHIDDYDLGDNEAEKRLLLLDVYRKILGAMEGIQFIGRFY